MVGYERSVSDSQTIQATTDHDGVCAEYDLSRMTAQTPVMKTRKDLFRGGCMRRASFFHTRPPANRDLEMNSVSASTRDFMLQAVDFDVNAALYRSSRLARHL